MPLVHLATGPRDLAVIEAHCRHRITPPRDDERDAQAYLFAKRTAPARGGVSPMIERSVVVLPAPLRPSSTVISPAGTVNSIPSSVAPLFDLRCGIALSRQAIASNTEHAGIIIVPASFRGDEFQLIADGIHDVTRRYPGGLRGLVVFCSVRRARISAHLD